MFSDYLGNQFDTCNQFQEIRWDHRFFLFFVVEPFPNLMIVFRNSGVGGGGRVFYQEGFPSSFIKKLCLFHYISWNYHLTV